MKDIDQLQHRIFENKKRQGFNTTKVEPEILFMAEELGEVAKANRNGDQAELIEEIVDIIIYGLGLLKILKVKASRAILAKIIKNEKRRYKKRGRWHIDRAKTK